MNAKAESLRGVASLLEHRLRAGRPFRYYAENERLRRLYDKVFAFLNASEIGSNILRCESKVFGAQFGKGVRRRSVLEFDQDAAATQSAMQHASALRAASLP